VHRKGPIKPFQREVTHRQLLEMILCFELDPLTAEELAECLDEYCVCGKTHDAGAARKQYARLKKELRTKEGDRDISS
jgi:chromosome segregation and condensation protein ScpB